MKVLLIGRNTCKKCGKKIWAGEVVKKQDGPHVLCDDPNMMWHRRIIFPDGDWGYVNDKGKMIKI
jgi:hypothetical protein